MTLALIVGIAAGLGFGGLFFFSLVRVASKADKRMGDQQEDQDGRST